MAQRTTAAAAAIAAQLETLPAVGRAFPFPQPMSVMSYGDLAMAIAGTSLPETMGPNTYQTVIWQCVVLLGSAATDGPALPDVQEQVADLTSADPQVGVIGLLRDMDVRDALVAHGSPVVTEDGCDVSYAADVDETPVTLVEFQITANVLVG